jgi:hypothetical protein
MDIPLSNDVIFNALKINQSYIIKYSDLSEFSDLSQAFGSKQFIIILIESNVNSGHWVSMYRKSSNEYIYFNSYGKKYDSDLDFISKMKNKILGNDVNTIRNLLETKDTLNYNHVKYQSPKSQVCGRYVINFVRQMRNGLSLKEYQSYLKKNKIGSYDETILKLTEDVQ